MMWCTCDMLQYDAMLWTRHCRSKILPQVPDQPGQEREARSWQGQFSSFSQNATQRRRTVISLVFFKIKLQRRKTWLPRCSPTTTVGWTSNLTDSGTDKKSLRTFLASNKNRGRDGLTVLPIFCRLKVLKKVPKVLPIWIQALKTHIVAVHYKKGDRWWDRLKSQCLQSAVKLWYIPRSATCAD